MSKLFLHVHAGVRYWEDSDINGESDTEGTLIPCRIDDEWCPIIDLDSGNIINWEYGKKASIHYKVCDDGSYYIKNSQGDILFEIEGDYVPPILCPDENGYGDYIIMTVDENGIIDGFNPVLDGFIRKAKGESK